MTMEKNFRGKKIVIKVENPNHVQKGIAKLIVDGKEIDGHIVPFEEGKKGEIANGQLADFVVLSEDPFKADANTLHRIEAKATYLGGKCVYKK